MGGVRTSPSGSGEVYSLFELTVHNGIPVAVLLVVVLGLMFLAIAIPAGAQTEGSEDPLELYDSNGYG